MSNSARWLCAALLIASAAEARAGPPASMTTGLTTKQPVGHFQFCVSHLGECGPNSELVRMLRTTPKMWADLSSVNLRVNREILPETDEGIFGRAEVWAYPSRRGDCEDFVLLKRRELEQLGYAASVLLITVVRQRTGEGHAVLTVVTDQGDFVLDNLDSRIRIWSDTGYSFLKRQSQEDSRTWVSIAPANNDAGAIASTR